VNRKTTIWLGSDDGEGMNGYDVHPEDSMVSIGFAGHDENDEDLEVFILPDLFPAIRKAMDTIEKRQRETGQ